MAINFPNSPSDGDQVTYSGVTYTYNATKGVWTSSTSLLNDYLEVANLQPQLDGYLQVANSTSFATTGSLDGYLQVANSLSFATTSSLDAYLQVANANFVTQSTLDGYLQVANSTSFATTSSLDAYLQVANSSSFASTSDLDAYLQVANANFVTQSTLDTYLQVANSTSLQTKADAVVSNNAILSLITDRLQVANLQPQLDKYLQVANSTGFAATTDLDAYLQVANANFVTQSTLDGYLQVANSTSFASTSSLDAYLQVANAITLTSFDVLTSTPSGNGSLVYNSSNGSFTFTPANATQGGSGGASVTVSDTAPSSPSDGDLWFDSEDLIMYVYYNDGSSSQWVKTSPSSSTDLSGYLQVANSTGFASTTDLDAYLQVANANFVNQSTLDTYLQVANSTSFATTSQLDGYLQVANSTSFASTSELNAYLQVANANFITQSTLDGYLQVANSTSFASTSSLDAYLQVANSTSFASTSSLDAYLQVANSTGFASSTDLDAYLQVANAITLTSFDVITSTPSGNGSLVYNSSNGSFTFTPANATQGGGGGGGGASVTASDTAPSSPSAGDLWFHTTQLKLYVYYSDGSSNQWIQTNGGTGTNLSVTTATASGSGSLTYANTGVFTYTPPKVEFIKAYRYDDTLAINTGTKRLYLQDSYTLKKIHAFVDTVPVGSSIITDVKKNGSSLQTITIAAGANTASNTSLNYSFVSGDHITVDITQVGSSTAGTNLYMVFTFN